MLYAFRDHPPEAVEDRAHLPHSNQSLYLT